MVVVVELGLHGLALGVWSGGSRWILYTLTHGPINWPKSYLFSTLLPSVFLSALSIFIGFVGLSLLLLLFLSCDFILFFSNLGFWEISRHGFAFFQSSWFYTVFSCEMILMGFPLLPLKVWAFIFPSSIRGFSFVYYLDWIWAVCFVPEFKVEFMFFLNILSCLCWSAAGVWTEFTWLIKFFQFMCPFLFIYDFIEVACECSTISSKFNTIVLWWFLLMKFIACNLNSWLLFSFFPYSTRVSTSSNCLLYGAYFSYFPPFGHIKFGQLNIRFWN